MEQLRGWFRQFSVKLSAGFQAFMMGRYGSDRLNMVILGVGLFASLASIWITSPLADIICVFLSYALMIWAICRGLSRNTYKRYQ